jgi:putative zinc finger/helix-turn-helix YgiT family protein
MEHSHQCASCEEHTVSTRQETRELKTKYGTGTYEAVVSVCSACGQEFVTPEQADVIDERVAQLRRRLKANERTLSGDMIREIREYLGLSQKEAAEIFGGGEVAFSRYEAESVNMGRPAEILLKMMYVWSDTSARIKAIRTASLDELRPLQASVEVTNVLAEIAVKTGPSWEALNKPPGIWARSHSYHLEVDLAGVPGAITASALDSFATEIDPNSPEPNVNHGRIHGYGSNRPQHSRSKKYSERSEFTLYRS